MIGKNNKPLVKEGFFKNQNLKTVVNNTVRNLNQRRGYTNLTEDEVKLVVMFYSKMLLECTDVGYRILIPHLGFIQLNSHTCRNIFKGHIKELQDNDIDPVDKPYFFTLKNGKHKKIYKRKAHEYYAKSIFNKKNIPDFKTFKYSYPRSYGRRQLPHDYEIMLKQLDIMEQALNNNYDKPRKEKKNAFSIIDYVNYQRQGRFGGGKMRDDDATNKVSPNDFI